MHLNLPRRRFRPSLLLPSRRRGLTRLDELGALLTQEPRFFGRAFSRLVQDVMRGPSDWTVGEREMLAAFAAHLNGSVSCARVHDVIAEVAMDEALVRSALTDWRSAQLSGRERAAFALIERVCADHVTADDMRTAQAAGLSRLDIEDLLDICGAITLLSSVANALGVTPPPRETVGRYARRLIRRGYRI